MNAQGQHSRTKSTQISSTPSSDTQIYVQLPKPLSDLVKRVYEDAPAKAARSLEAGLDLARVSRNFDPALGFVNGENRLVSTRVRMDARCHQAFTEIKTTFSLKTKPLIIAGLWHATRDMEANLFNFHWRQMRDGR